MNTEETNLKTNNPKVSVIVPVYNVEQYLEECVQSILSQTYQNIEIVLVDDGSTDSSPEILEEYRKKYPELIQVVHTDNQGLGAASNNGVAAARGEYIAFLDSDDYLSANAVKEMREACSLGDDICIFDL